MTTLISLVSSATNLTPKWQNATWEDYLNYRDAPITERVRLYFYQNRLLVEMGSEGINHSNISDLFTMLFAFWFAQKPEVVFSSYGGCLLEKPTAKIACAPNIVLYLGENYPRWQPEERRYLNLEQWRIPDLVGEISDTTLASDLDEKKYLYAQLGIPEYWVVDVRAGRVIAFALQKGKYEEIDQSKAIEGLAIELLEQTLAQLSTGTNGSAAHWFAKAI
ncbi:MAG: Uma2 family endonuclease [Gomphosphaeria aponina SAG 52.96 = DSM 107014]|uniref:Uma2 family endonuclease n=1 Tax=Gomphosphaeria aponina SAG 52.96 = DSM 107014 TaxID=1521640 RepID=A0A941JSC9_9CHRO|nr:Uma2 family endonuclease [Gomphosphaeria aponina SAG 52.96 = DSM 107014]